MAGSVGGDANTLLALGVKATTVDGVISASFFPDAKDATDEYVKQFMEINTKYNKGVTFDNIVLQGMNSAMLTVQALRAAGKNLTRTGLMKLSTQRVQPLPVPDLHHLITQQLVVLVTTATGLVN
jgi:branched-chain amino acid transport system substrate-binding protein